MVTEEMISMLKTKKGGFSKRIIDLGKSIYGVGWLYKLRRDEENGIRNFYKLFEVIPKSKAKNNYAEILNKYPCKPDGWNWKPKDIDIPKIKHARAKSKNKVKRTKITRKEDAEFYLSREWKDLRVRVLEKYGCRCMMCGRSPKDHGVIIHVDHIKPRSKRPDLSLDFNNLQILCEDCNKGKSNKYDTDYRPPVRKKNMLWFRHSSTASMTADLMKLTKRYGFKGYGLYWLCIELMTNNADVGQESYSLEHGDRALAHISMTSESETVEIMNYIRALGILDKMPGVLL